MKDYNPKEIKSINDAIDNLQTFLECDLYTKFRPEVKINDGEYVRDDVFKDENEFIEYLENHFNILRKEIKEVQNES